MNGLARLVERLWVDRPLAEHTTLRVGGPARAVAMLSGPRELADLFGYLHRHQVPSKVIGKGANLLVTDAGFDGVVIVLGHGFAWLEPEGDGIVSVGAGLSLSTLAWRLSRMGITGFEFAAQIPGTVGGALVNNAGAFSQDFTSRVVSVATIEPDGSERVWPATELALRYRHSVFKGGQGQDRCLIWARLRGEPGPVDPSVALIEDYGRRRAATQPVSAHSAGCIFKNPAGHKAGHLIERAGLKGATVGEALVSERHANFIVNRGAARARDVLDLIRKVKDTVLERHGVLLETEVEIVGRP